MALLKALCDFLASLGQPTTTETTDEKGTHHFEVGVEDTQQTRDGAG